jgi:hypothetical protein
MADVGDWHYIIAIVLASVCVHVLFSDLVEATAVYLKEKTRLLNRENDLAEKSGAGNDN